MTTITEQQLHARLRAEVALASDVLVPAWPIASFIAVNPLGGLEHHGFEEAVRRAGAALGARGHLDEERFRQLAATGRITDPDLGEALERRHPEVVAAPALALGGRELPAREVLVLDLRHAPAAPPVAADPTVGERVDALLGTRIARALDEEVGGWCAAFLDEGQSSWAMPGRERGLYGAWKAVAARDRGLRRLGAGDLRPAIAALPDDPAAALLAALTRLDVAPERRVDELRRQLGRGAGWASAIRWRAEHRGDDTAPADLTELLAIRVSLETLLVCAAAERAFGSAAPMPELQRALAQDAAAPAAGGEGSGQEARLRAVAAAAGERWPLEAAAHDALAQVLGLVTPQQRLAIWQEAYEEHWRGGLLRALDVPPAPPAPRAPRPRATVVCCIDARSEGLRRHLERTGPYETLGFAGFFAVAMRYRALGSAGADALCPVLLTPRNEVTEEPAAGEDERAARWIEAGRSRAAAARTLHRVREDLATPFALAEASGWLLGPQALARTLAPGAYDGARRRIGRAPEPATRMVIDRHGETEDLTLGFTRDEQIALARTALTMMGLVRGFGRLVLLCGHGSATENNPYEAALDCGACGGNQGGPNARVAAAILNRPYVRDALRVGGIEVPEDTWFLAGQHDTAADTVAIFDRELVPAGHRADLSALEADLRTAGAANSAERLARLPGARPARDARIAHRRVARRGRDWAQIRPEWGLARNAAFIAGPRSMTRDLDLECRAFLHSYDADVDADGSALETILTAPLVVAQWINCQYYFSTVDPERFGAGTKTIHNVVAGLGVLRGPSGDLQLGLPLQGALDGDRLYHEPLRLLAVVQAPRARIDDIIRRNPVLQHLIGGEWVALAAREHPGDGWSRRTEDGAWAPWGAPAGAPAVATFTEPPAELLAERRVEVAA